MGRLEEAEAKRQEMLDAQKADKAGSAAKKSTAGTEGNDARKEMTKTKEQLEEEKKIALSIRIKPLDLDAMDTDDLKAKATELFNIVIQLETDKYDYEQKRQQQERDLQELKERQKAQLRQKALKKGLDPEALVGKYPPMIRMYSKYERRTDVGPPLILGVHADHGGVLANKGLRVKTLLQGLLSELSLLPLLQLLQAPLLLVVVLVCLKLDDNVEQLGGLSLQVVSVHGVKVEGPDSDGKSNLLLLLQLLLGLGHLLAGIVALSASSGLLGGRASLVGLLGIEHLLPLGLGLFQALLLLLGLSGPLVCLLFPQLLLLFLLRLVELLLLLGPDLLPLGLLLLQLLQLLLLLLPGLPPF